MSDAELLRQFVQGRSQTAFSELVRRHVDWVHSVALRGVHDPHLAEDVTQATFLVLAQKAASLQKYKTLSAWLFHVVTHIADRVRRNESLRKRHETKAALAIRQVFQTQSAAMGQNEWDQIVNVLDELVGKLRAGDRQILLLRFYQKMSFAEVAEALEITEEAARKRVSRAIEKLRGMLLSKGVSMPNAILASTLLAEATKPAPTALSATASVPPIAASVSEKVIAMAKGATKMMVMAKLKVAAATLATFVLAAGTLALVVAQQRGPTTQRIAAKPPTSQPQELGVDDLIEIDIAEFVMPQVVTTFYDRVDPNGQIRLPLVGIIDVKGLAPDSAAKRINMALAEKKLIRNAKIQIRRTEAGSNATIRSGPLAVNDSVRIRLWNVEGSPGQETLLAFVLSPDGSVALPRIGTLTIAGMTESQVEEAMARAYRSANILITQPFVECLRVASPTTRPAN